MHPTFHIWVVLICIMAAMPAPAAQRTAPSPTTRPLSETDRLYVSGFRFRGNTVFTDAQLAKALEPYRGEVSIEQLEEARQLLTRMYVEHPRRYINSGAIIPEQTVSDGIITFLIVEGTVSDIVVEGIKTDRPKRGVPATTAPAMPRPTTMRSGFRKYIHDRIKVGTKPPLTLDKLRHQLELIRQDPRVERINAELRPGTQLGEAIVEAKVEEANPYQIGLEFSNKRSPSVGSEELDLLVSSQNLTGHGDALSLRWAVLQSGFEDPQESARFPGLDEIGIDYSVPINPYDTTLGFNYTRSNSLVIETAFQDLDITSESSSYAATLRHPLLRSHLIRAESARPSEMDLAVSASFAYRENQSFLLGEPFSFSPGADEDARTRITVIRLGQELSLRNERHAFAARSTFNFGISAFGGTDAVEADGDFVTWLGQLQYVTRVMQTNNQVVARVNAQLANDSLPSLEQFSVGGMNTVRGYRENQFVRDNAVTATLELHVPVISGKSGQPNVLELVPFFDIGYAWNDRASPPEELLSSAGVGLVYNPNRHVSCRVFYGYAFDDVDNGEEDNLQDYGIHFELLVLAF